MRSRSERRSCASRLISETSLAIHAPPWPGTGVLSRRHSLFCLLSTPDPGLTTPRSQAPPGRRPVREAPPQALWARSRPSGREAQPRHAAPAPSSSRVAPVGERHFWKRFPKIGGAEAFSRLAEFSRTGTDPGPSRVRKFADTGKTWKIFVKFGDGRVWPSKTARQITWRCLAFLKKVGKFLLE